MTMIDAVLLTVAPGLVLVYVYAVAQVVFAAYFKYKRSYYDFVMQQLEGEGNAKARYQKEA